MRRIVPWLAAAAVVSALFATMYGVAQQIERQGASDAPERLATQIASQLSSQSIDELDVSTHVDLASSEALFFVIYDSSDTPVAGTGYLNGSLATVPRGVIASTRSSGHDRVSWQTPSGLRFATVELKAGDKVVVAGQSLAPSETRTISLARWIGAAWLATLLIGAAFYLVTRLIPRKSQK